MLEESGEVGGDTGEVKVAARAGPGLLGGFGEGCGLGLLMEDVSDDGSVASLRVVTICAPVEACPAPWP